MLFQTGYQRSTETELLHPNTFQAMRVVYMA